MVCVTIPVFYFISFVSINSRKIRIIQEANANNSAGEIQEDKDASKPLLNPQNSESKEESGSGFLNKDIDEASYNQKMSLSSIPTICKKIWFPTMCLCLIYFGEYISLTSFGDRLSYEWNKHQPNDFVKNIVN